MADTLHEAIRERATTRNLVGWAVVVAVLYALLGSSPLQLATSLGTGAVVGAAGLTAEVYDLRDEVKSLALGVVSLVGGAAWVAVEGGYQSAGAVFLLVGTWTALDAVQVLRHRGLRDPSVDRSGREVHQEYVARRVHEAVRDEPRTTRELRASLDADDAAVDRAVERLVDRGAVSRAGSELRATAADGQSDPSGHERLRSTVAGLIRRLARPITIEFESAESSRGVP